MIEIFTDGGCRGNDSSIACLSAFSYIILVDGEKIREFSASCNKSTNNRMEIMAAISAMKYLVTNQMTKDKVILYSDSAYLVNTVNLGWKKNRNTDLWTLLTNYYCKLNIDFVKVPGHSDCEWNNYVDELLNYEMDHRKNCFTDQAYK